MARNYDAVKYEFISNSNIKPTESGIYFSRNEIRVSPQSLGNCGFWIHEFSELTTIRILARWKKNWRKTIRINGFNPCSISHLITPCGMANNRCLIPETKETKTDW